MNLARKIGLGYLRLNYGNLPQQPGVETGLEASQAKGRASEEWVLMGVRRYS